MEKICFVNTSNLEWLYHKIGFKTKPNQIKPNQTEGQFIMINRSNPSGRYKNYKYMCT